MKKQEKEKDLICGNCGYVFPLKCNSNYLIIDGFKYAYCFRCRQMTRHQLIEPLDIYKKSLEYKEPEEYTTKDKILKRVIK